MQETTKPEPEKRTIHLLGTNHIAGDSAENITRAFAEYNPDIVAVELDRNRLQALLNNDKPSYHPRMIRHVGVTGYIFAVLTSIIQRKLGEHTGFMPGHEMLHAVETAKKHDRLVALIDRPIQQTLQSISDNVGFTEKLKVVRDVVFAPFIDQPEIQINPSGTPTQETVHRITKYMEKRYPGVYKAVVDERDDVLYNSLMRVQHEHPEKTILAVVGAAHIPGIQRRFNGAQQ